MRVTGVLRQRSADKNKSFPVGQDMRQKKLPIHVKAGN
jgi:hypothetical protein